MLTGALEQEVRAGWPRRFQIDEGSQVFGVGAVLHEAMRSLQWRQDAIRGSQPEQLASEGGMLHYSSSKTP